MPKLPMPVIDDERFLSVIRDSTVSDDDDNDWTHLLDESPLELGYWNEPELLVDLFVLCRSRTELFGGAWVDGCVEAFKGVGGYDEDQSSDVACVVSVRIDERLAVAGELRLIHELFGASMATARSRREAALAGLRVIGTEASRIVERYNALEH